ncbi:universal stress protein [Rhodocaloribacter litoris]|uniref:universal stress protein n=1 Tax=Rhodocaloribacter litoris TaxID=2558931 RepID=UPI001424106A|nr:universal stress protein [Rhodocaloribacter litoris]QXD16932.1 universal stress protein [Rhodocaloribacter litoris]
MLRIQRILIPTDFSPCAEAAVAQGVELARRCGARVRVLHVEEEPGRGTWRGMLHRLLEEVGLAEAFQRRVHEQVQARTAARNLHDVEVEEVRQQGEDVARVILQYAATNDVDLIVMGTHGHRSLRHPALGGVTGEVVRQAGCPVLAVHAPEEAPPAPHPLKRVLVPVDFSEPAVVALRHARALAGLYEASLTLLFVAEERVVPSFSDTGLPVFITLRLPPEVVRQSEAALQQLFETTPGPPVPVTCRVRHGHPAREILACAREEDADLIVLSTHGAGGGRGFHLGSVAEHVVRAAPHTVLTLNPSGRWLVD